MQRRYKSSHLQRRLARRSPYSNTYRLPSRKVCMIAGMIAVPVAVLTAGFYSLNAQISQKKIDPLTYCYQQDKHHQTAVFIDYSFTNSTSAAQDRDLKTTLERAYRELPPNGRLSIFTTSRDTEASLVEPALSICRPSATLQEQVSIGGPDKPQPYLKRQAEEARQTYEQKTRALLVDAKDEEKAAKDSPILEQIQAISRYSFSSPLRKFYVFTDGIQNTEISRFCAVKNHMPPFSIFKKGNTYQYVKPDPLENVEVEFLLIEGGSLPSSDLPFCSNDELRTFWPAYFKASGANVRLTRLRYGASS